jgi:subtilisin family serine protease
MRRVTTAAALIALVVAIGQASAADLKPNDPTWGSDWAQHLLNMPALWGQTTGSSQIVIATVDSGVDPSVPDLKGQLVPGWDFFNNDAIPRDTDGHGTQLASVLVGRGNDGAGMAGYCWDCKLMPVRVSSGGSTGQGMIAQGIRWAVDHGARIVVSGLNGPGPPEAALADAVSYARNQGVLVVVSAGNAGTADFRYPAAFTGALAVAATSDSDGLYFWSTRGPWVQLAAPGCQLVHDPSVGPGTLCGTSFTPGAVAGIAGLLFSLKPGITANQMYDALVKSAKPIVGIGGGRVDPLAAAKLLGLEGVQTSTPVVAAPPATSTVVTTIATTAGRQLFARVNETSVGVMRGRLVRSVTLGRGRVEVQVQVARARACQLGLIAPNGDETLSLQGEPTLISITDTVRAKSGRYRILLTCPAKVRRSFTLSITARRPIDVSSKR